MFAFARGFFRRLSIPALILVSCVATGRAALAGDKTWDNGSGDFIWNTSSLNWTGTAWNNGNGDGAIFGSIGAGTISVPAGIFLDSINFNSGSNYTFNGVGPFTFVDGTSTQTTGVINVASGATVQINVPIASSVTAFQKIGGGVLELSQPLNITASYPVVGNGLVAPISANVIVGPAGNGLLPVGGTLRVLNGSVLSATTSVALGSAGILDIGANTVNIGGLTFLNQNNPGPPLPYPGSYGVVGTGTLRVNGEINVVGVINQLNFGNAIDSGLDLGSGTQVIRVASGGSFARPAALMITGTISGSGSLLKTNGYNDNGVIIAATSQDGMGLFGNNTYTGSTIINGGAQGFSMATGTNASTSMKIVNGTMSVQGANGSYGAATTIQVSSGGTLSLDNNAAFGDAGFSPVVPAANNGNRISDTAAITLRDGNLTYRGLTGVASSETYGSMNVTGGHNTLTIAPTGAGTATFAATGNLTMDSRSTLQISATSAILGTTGFVKFGSVPTPVGGIIPRVVSTTDFVTYDATNGFMPLPAASYQSTYVAGANVALTAAAATGSVAINAVKTTGTFATTINSGEMLTVTSGMMFATSGTHTVSGGTLNFGPTAGVLIGNQTINSAVAGSQGLLASGSGTVTLAGDLTNLTGAISNIGAGALTLSGAAANYTGTIENRRGSLNINASSAGGAITIGVSANETNLVPANPSTSIAGAGANAIISRDIIVDNGGTNAAGVALNRQTVLPTLSALSNTTGSQTITGNLTLNTSISHTAPIGPTSTGATNYNGNISGAGTFLVNAGRVNLNGNISTVGGVSVFASGGGQTAIVNFGNTATSTGNFPIFISAGNSSLTGISYFSQSNISGGPITVNAAGFSLLPTIRILADSSISNPVNMPAGYAVGPAFVGGVNVDVAPTFTGTWTGPVTGGGSVNKLNSGTLVLSNSGNTYTGNTTVTAGTLRLEGTGSFALSPTITVGAAFGPVLDVTGVTGGSNFDPTLLPGGSFSLAFGQTLKGAGTVSGEAAIKSGSTLAPGNSIGTLNFDSNVAIDGTLVIETSATPGFDQLNLTGGANLLLTANSVLSLPLSNTYDGVTPLAIVQLSSGTITGTFGSVLNLPSQYQVQYLGNSIMLAQIPEPGTLLLSGLAASAMGWTRWRRRRQTATAAADRNRI